MLPKCCFIRNNNTYNKLATFKNIKEYIVDQICLKNIISKINDVEKLKYALMNERQVKFFNQIENPNYNILDIKNGGVGSLWGMIDKGEDYNVESHYNECKNKITKSQGDQFDRNLCRLCEWIYEIR
jgi:hypothetical protein